MSKQRQELLNSEMVKLGTQRYWSRVSKAQTTGESNTVPGRHLMDRCTTDLASSVRAWKASVRSAKAGKGHRCLDFLDLLQDAQVAVITSKVILDALSTERMFTTVSIAIGRALEDEVLMQDLAKNNPQFFRKVKRLTYRSTGQAFKRRFARQAAKAVDLVTTRWSKGDAMAVGVLLIELFIQSTGIIKIDLKTNPRGRRYNTIAPTQDIKDWIKQSHQYHDGLVPLFLPMIVSPIPWKNPWIGGYNSMDWKPRPLVKSRSKPYQESLGGVDLSQVYAATNVIQSTPWKVNTRILELLELAWENSWEISTLPETADAPLPTKPHDIDTNMDARRQWRKAAAKIHFKNESLESSRFQFLKTLYVANKFKDETRLYFPQQLDFRGRTYPLPLFLNPQGPSYTKALLEFSNTCPIKTDTDVMCLELHLANCWGHDKQSHESRLKWVQENHQAILQIGSDPTTNQTWCTADDPFAFAAACIDYKQLHDHGRGYPSRLPVGIDATTQGLQIYAMLLRDPIAAAATNVIHTGTTPSDPYQVVADFVIQQLKADGSDIAMKLLGIGIDRGTTKRQTMTLAYGLTRHSCRAYTREWLESRGAMEIFGIDTYKPVSLLSDTIWNSMGNVVGSARTGMDWIQDCVRVLVQNDVTPTWVTPLGLPVRMRYENSDAVEVKTKIGAKARINTIRVDNGIQSTRKAVNGGPPNYVHSLDGIGGLLGMTAIKCKDLPGFGSVHDQMVGHASSIPHIHRSVRESTVEMFSQDLLSDFRTGHLTSSEVSITIPELPKYGTLDISRVLKSPYYFN